MRPERHRQLLEDIEALRAWTASVPIEQLVLQAFLIVSTPPHETRQRHGLSSAARQMWFLLGLATTTSGPASIPSAPIEFRSAFKQLERIYGAYAEMFDPAAVVDEQERSLLTERWPVVALTFINYFHSGVLASNQQIESQIEQILAPFDNELTECLGLSASDALAICRAITERLQDQLDSQVKVLSRVATVWRRARAEGWSNERALAEARADTMLSQLSTDPEAQDALGRYPLEVVHADMRNRFKAAWDAFSALFMTRRGTTQAFVYPTDANPAERAPLLELDADRVAYAGGNILPQAVLDRLGEALVKTPAKIRFLAHRDRTHERRVEMAFRTLLTGSDVQIVSHLAEAATGDFEHDLLIRWDRRLLAIECKASPLRTPLREPTRAYPRIRDDFRSDRGIQKAFVQASRVRHGVLSSGGLVLFDRRGMPALQVSSTEIDEVYCVCVTADDYGVLATDLTLLLDKPSEVPYPWAVNATDLEALADAFRRRAWGAAELIAYLEQRQKLHGHVHTADELEIAGIFVRHGTLDSLLDQLKGLPETHIMLTPETATVFDDLYAEKHGGPPARLDAEHPLSFTDLREALRPSGKEPQSSTPAPLGWTSPTRRNPGRNQPCWCGSGKKFKRCHGA